MTGPSPRRFGRRALLGGGLGWILASVSARAQPTGRGSDQPTGRGSDQPTSPQRGASGGSSRLTTDQLKQLIQTALAEPDETPLSRPAILGLGEKALKTKSIERTPPGEKYGFMVVIPQRDDGLVFFRGQDKTENKPMFFAIHRTGSNLKRVASAINRDGKLEVWAGVDADRDFAKQLAFWAK